MSPIVAYFLATVAMFPIFLLLAKLEEHLDKRAAARSKAAKHKPKLH